MGHHAHETCVVLGSRAQSRDLLFRETPVCTWLTLVRKYTRVKRVLSRRHNDQLRVYIAQTVGAKRLELGASLFSRNTHGAGSVILK